MTYPTWYHDGQLSLARGRMTDAYAALARTQEEALPGPVTPEITAARAAAWQAEAVFAERFMEVQAQEAARTEDWRPGDWVLDAKGQVWVRAHPEDAGKGWPWGYPSEAGARALDPDGQERVILPEGAVAEDDPVRPLVLMIRNGYPASPGTA